MRQMIRYWPLTILVLLLAACGSAPTSDQAATGASPSAAPSVVIVDRASDTPSAAASAAASAPSSAAPSPIGSADGTAVIFTRSGGFAGRTETLIVGADGALQRLSGDAQTGSVVGTGQASQAQLDALKAELAGAEWQALGGKFGQQVPDGFAYSITGGGKQVVTYDGTTNPAVLERVLGQLSGLLQAAQPAASASTQ